jgi:hypothetical protein
VNEPKPRESPTGGILSLVWLCERSGARAVVGTAGTGCPLHGGWECVVAFQNSRHRATDPIPNIGSSRPLTPDERRFGEELARNVPSANRKANEASETYGPGHRYGEAIDIRARNRDSTS